MASRHKEVLLKEFEDEELVGDMMENVQKGFCTICHRGFDGNVREEDIEKLHACANCHERKDSEKNEEFVAQMIVDVEQGRCTLCHGDFDHNAGEKVARLGHCAQCHRFSHDRDWQGRQDQRPCMSCHSDAAQFPWASIPNTNTCAACHPLDGELKGTKAEESELLGYIAGKEMISWSRVYDYLPRDIVFSHERHVELGGVRCQQCHGHVELVDGPLSLQIELSMEDCMDCHAAMGAENDCMECHK